MLEFIPAQRENTFRLEVMVDDRVVLSHGVVTLN